MTDPFSVATGALGVVSLGLTVCEGMISYYSAFKGQYQCLDDLTRKTEGLKGCLSILLRELPSWRASVPNAARQIEDSIDDCKPAISFLESKLANLQQVYGTSLHRGKVRHIAQKALFPMKKGALVEMSATMGSLQQNLEIIISIANLYGSWLFSLGAHLQLTAIREASSSLINTQTVTNIRLDALISASDVVKANGRNAARGISVLQIDTSEIRKDLHAVKATFDPGLQTVLHRLDSLSNQVEKLQFRMTPSASGTQHLV